MFVEIEYFKKANKDLIVKDFAPSKKSFINTENIIEINVEESHCNIIMVGFLIYYLRQLPESLKNMLES